MNFHEDQFPTNLSFGATGGPERRTEIVTLGSGFEERNTPWQDSLRRFDAGLAVQSLDDIQGVIAFFEARQGQLYGFRWKDWADYKSAPPSQTITDADQILGVSDGLNRVFQLVKTYTSGGQNYQRIITKPVMGTVIARAGRYQLQENIHFTVDYTTGFITLKSIYTRNTQIKAGFEFDVPVRFDTDRLDINIASFHAGEVPSIPVVELRINR